MTEKDYKYKTEMVALVESYKSQLEALYRTIVFTLPRGKT